MNIDFIGTSICLAAAAAAAGSKVNDFLLHLSWQKLINTEKKQIKYLALVESGLYLLIVVVVVVAPFWLWHRLKASQQQQQQGSAFQEHNSKKYNKILYMIFAFLFFVFFAFFLDCCFCF